MQNDLLYFFKQNAELLKLEYERISKYVKEDAGTAGDEGEENWKKLLQYWLPSGYHVTTKGRIIFPDGSSSGQIDVIVLKPEYPRGLIDNGIKKYLACSVAAAFECKLTLRSEHFEKIFRTSMAIKTRLSHPIGTPFNELNSPIIYGVLAHEYNDKIDDKSDSIEKAIERHFKNIKHPKEMPDIFCIANCGTWSALKLNINPNLYDDAKVRLASISAYGHKDLVAATYMNSNDAQET
jgi:hypothetical protein